jgi:hypothetical protein
VLFAFGRHLLFRELGRGSWVYAVAVVAVLMTIRFWPRVVAWAERRWRSR